MDPETKEFIENNNPIFVLFESVCPECGEEVKMKSIGGLPEFLDEWDIPKGIEPTVWKRSPRDNGVGGIEFVCSNGHTHYVEKNKFGDWN